MIELDVLSAADLAVDEDARAAQGQPLPWRSAADRTGAPGMAAMRRTEFAAPPDEREDPETSRRTFLKVMGASAALAGLTGCRRPVETIVPYARKPQEVIPGIPSFFATAMPFAGVGKALLVQSHEGRPVKIEGNPEHPVSQGASDAFAQASVLQLYDPDRSRSVAYRDAADRELGRADWSRFVQAAASLRGTAGRIAVLAEPTSSPTLLALRQQFESAYPNARWITMSATGDSHEALGLQAAFGQPVRPLMRLSEADVVVSFDGDFLSDPHAEVWNAREYAQSRRADAPRGAGRAPMSRLYIAESTMTPTGGMADHRLRMKAGQVPFFAAAVAAGLGVDAGTRGAITPEQQAVVTAIVQDVRAAGGRAAFVAGETQPPAVHALAAALNGRFGAQTSGYVALDQPAAEPLGPAVEALVRDMASGQIDAVVMLGTNPVYTLPADSGFAEALARVPVSVHHGLYRDESAQASTWHLPAAHYLESWGDTRALDGTLSVIQPLISPLYAEAHSDVEVLNALVTGRNNAGYDLVRRTMQGRLGGIAGNFEDAWRTALHDGFVGGTAYAAVGAPGGVPSLAGVAAPPTDGVELVFRPSPTLYDGQFSNVAWMQEAPHPVTKTTWDPVALMSRATAERLGLETDETGGKAYCSVAQFSTGEGKAAQIPVWVQPGQPDDSVTVYLGYGRDIATERALTEENALERVVTWLRPGHTDTDPYRLGPVAHLAGAGLIGDPGDNRSAARAEKIRSLANLTVFPGAAVSKVGDGYLVASTQDHGSMEGRAIIRSATVGEYQADPKFAQDEELFIENTPWEAYPPLWGEENSASDDPRIGQWIYSDNQWGMTIDLNACSGCNACVVACQSENNVPVVGKEQVSRGREMHWLRTDRYYIGDQDDPGMITQVMMCQHCENAPCEQVCPVNATAHSPDGLNEMTYNRCIGTRYCANNCPYKVRRYNFYNWTKTLPIEVQMANNPYVTVRYRGVMEKCTFCVQRIRQTQQYAHIEDRKLQDGEIQTACQQACAANAIVFGDLADTRSAVTRSKTSPRNYAVLGELAVKPRLTYLARLRNPHPSLAGRTPFDLEDEMHAEA